MRLISLEIKPKFKVPPCVYSTLFDFRVIFCTEISGVTPPYRLQSDSSILHPLVNLQMNVNFKQHAHASGSYFSGQLFSNYYYTISDKVFYIACKVSFIFFALFCQNLNGFCHVVCLLSFIIAL